MDRIELPFWEFSFFVVCVLPVHDLPKTRNEDYQKGSFILWATRQKTLDRRKIGTRDIMHPIFQSANISMEVLVGTPG